jgi:hypothetical protein
MHVPLAGLDAELPPVPLLILLQKFGNCGFKIFVG